MQRDVLRSLLSNQKAEGVIRGEQSIIELRMAIGIVDRVGSLVVPERRSC